MRRKCAFIAVAVVLMLLSSCDFRSYGDRLEHVPSWLIGDWEASEKVFDRLYISSNDIRGWIGGREVTVRDDLRYNCGVEDEFAESDLYFLELYYGGGRRKSFQFILDDSGNTLSVKYTETGYGSLNITETFTRQ